MAEPVTATASAAVAHALSPVELFLQADAIVKTVIVLLILASAWGWAVIGGEARSPSHLCISARRS